MKTAKVHEPVGPQATNDPIESELTSGSWWLWMVWVEREGGGGFVYGCAARNSRLPGWSDEAAIEIPGGKLVVHQATVAEDSFAGLREALSAGQIDASSVLPSRKGQVRVAATRAIFQTGLGQSGVRTVLHYTLPNVQDLVGSQDGALEGVLSVLQEQLGLPFKGAYAAHLGNFELFELHPWLEAPYPLLIEAVPNPDLDRSRPQVLDICRLPEFATTAHIAHIVGRVNGEVVLDRLVKLPPGDRRVPVTAPETLDEFDFRVFSEDRETLLHSEQAHFLNRIGFTLAPVNRQMTIEDDLSNRAKSKDKGLGSQASTVISHSSHRSMIGAPAPGSWRKFAEDMEQTRATSLPVPSEDKWFPRGIEGEIGAIAHLNHLIDAGQITKAVLVDPWFGTDALHQFVLRLSSQNVGLTILTSWTNIDPDTNDELPPGESPTAKLEAALRKLQPFLTPRLAMLNLVDGKDHAFHDRYLLLYPHEYPAKVFLLSNSINKVAGNWPFAMSLLASDISRQVQRYIEALADGRDIARNKSLTVNFRWPSNAA
jgi:hypothetical protein